MNNFWEWVGRVIFLGVHESLVLFFFILWVAFLKWGGEKIIVSITSMVVCLLHFIQGPHFVVKRTYENVVLNVICLSVVSSVCKGQAEWKMTI